MEYRQTMRLPQLEDSQSHSKEMTSRRNGISKTKKKVKTKQHLDKLSFQ